VSLICVDVDYRPACVVTAVLAFDAWESALAAREVVAFSDAAPAGYVPGSFYERELPYVLAGLAELGRVTGLAGLAGSGQPAEAQPGAARARAIVIDGYVWLGAGKPGLGAHLHEALGQRTPVVGVAKRRFHGAVDAVAILRGTSQVPLFVTAVGIDVAEAAAGVQRMHGAHRIPTLLKRVDRLSRDAVAGSGSGQAGTR
jgi:deoxyribonuclease V